MAATVEVVVIHRAEGRIPAPELGPLAREREEESVARIGNGWSRQNFLAEELHELFFGGFLLVCFVMPCHRNRFEQAFDELLFLLVVGTIDCLLHIAVLLARKPVDTDTYAGGLLRLQSGSCLNHFYELHVYSPCEITSEIFGFLLKQVYHTTILKSIDKIG